VPALPVEHQAAQARGSGRQGPGGCYGPSAALSVVIPMVYPIPVRLPAPLAAALLLPLPLPGTAQGTSEPLSPPPPGAGELVLEGDHIIEVTINGETARLEVNAEAFGTPIINPHWHGNSSCVRGLRAAGSTDRSRFGAGPESERRGSGNTHAT